MAKKEKELDEATKSGVGENLLSYIIASTYARHAKKTEDEFLEDIGFSGSGKTEDEAVRIAIANALIETTKCLMSMRNEMGGIKSMVEMALAETEAEMETEKGEKKDEQRD